MEGDLVLFSRLNVWGNSAKTTAEGGKRGGRGTLPKAAKG